MPKDYQMPTRTCIATGVKKPKSQMIRLVRLENDQNGYSVEVDSSGKAKGRGANIDSTMDAFEQAIAKGAIPRALKLERKLEESEIDDLRDDFKKILEQKEFRKGRKKVTLKVSQEEFKRATLN